jgi:CRISPR-associated endonuclease/helicase Cas3
VAARKLQNYIVQVPPKDRSKLIENGHVKFVDGFGDQFAVLVMADFYSSEIGLLWEKADELGMEQLLI